MLIGFIRNQRKLLVSTDFLSMNPNGTANKFAVHNDNSVITSISFLHKM
jgi:hypothetical protein